MNRHFISILATVGCCFYLAVAAVSQTAKPVSPTPKVTHIDINGLKGLLKPTGKPRLINFWATWCDPCREEYPDLVKIDEQYRGKIDFITVSLDYADDKDIVVPKFLTQMKADMPAYLLITDDDEAAMSVVSKDWTGALPLTVLYDAKGGIEYLRQGKVKIDLLKAALDKSVTPPAPAGQE